MSMKVVTAEKMRQLERQADASGLTYATMMENAGRGVADACQRMGITGKRILVLVGPGNNGGDGLVAARHLHDAGARVMLYLWKRSTDDASAPILGRGALLGAGASKGDENFRLTQERNIPVAAAENDGDFAVLRCHLAEADFVIDALLGTGVTRPIEGVLKELLTVVAAEIERRQLAGTAPTVVAVDLPTGLNPDTGEVDSVTPTCDLTVTFAFPKQGLLQFPGAERVGKLVVADIGIPPTWADEVMLEMTTPDMVRAWLPRRPLGAHKGTFGKAMIVAGSANYTGAAYLAGAAATRVGTGLVMMALARAVYPIVAAKLVETTFLVLPDDLGAIVPDAVKLLAERVGDYDALLIGPGLGREKVTVEFVHRLLGLEALGKAKTRLGFRAGAEEEPAAPEVKLPPLIVDADGLNALAEAAEWWKVLRPGCILTPHPGEMARLMGAQVEDIEADRVGVARRMAQEWQQVIVLKGAYTVIAAPDGRAAINPFANPGLATGGTGDVLAGAIVGLLAQGLEPYAAAAAGAYLHGLAAERVRAQMGDAGMVAGDLLLELPRAIASVKNQVA
jgi:NAD(P)H-hydrate epimerase